MKLFEMSLKRLLQHCIFLLIFSIWLFAFYHFTIEGRNNFSSWRTDWIRWDSTWYEKIWTEGYSFIDSRMLVFPPGYSGFIGLISSLAKVNFHLVAFLINPVFFYLGSFLSARLLASKFHVSKYLIFIFLLSNPVAYFAFATYSDMAFYFLFWLLLTLEINVENENKKTALLKMFLYLIAPWIRLTGIVLCAWIFLRKKMAFLAAFSVFLWLTLNTFITADPFYFIKAQQLFGMPNGNFIDGLQLSLSGFLNPPRSLNSENLNSYLQLNFLPIIYLFGAILTGIWLFLRREYLFSISILTILFVSHNQAFWRSAVRYDLPLLPFLFVAIMYVISNYLFKNFPKLKAIFILCFLIINFIMQIHLAKLFHNGSWGF